MKRHVNILLLSVLAMAFSAPIHAQALRSGYFMDGNFSRLQLNPAFEADHSFLAFPLLSNLDIDVNANVGLGNFLFHNDFEDRLTTFMNSDVDANDFLGKLPLNTTLNQNFDMTLAAAGFRIGDGYATLALNLHEDVMANVPYEFFKFAKCTFQYNDYHIRDLNLDVLSYASLEAGYSRKIFDIIRVGGRVKLLAGLANLNFDLQQIDLTVDNSKWLLQAQTNMNLAALGGVSVITNADGGYEDYELAGYIPSNWGAALDLGAEYHFKTVPGDLSISASVTNLGFIKWKKMLTCKPIDGTVTYDGMGTVDYDNLDNVESELAQLEEDLMGMIHIDETEQISMTTSIPTTLQFGAEYKMPFYDALSVAALGTVRSNNVNPYKSFRGFVNISPLNWLQASVNVGASNYGTEFGWIVNIHPRAGLSLFVGSDYFASRLSADYVPVDRVVANFAMGINVPIK